MEHEKKVQSKAPFTGKLKKLQSHRNIFQWWQRNIDHQYEKRLWEACKRIIHFWIRPSSFTAIGTARDFWMSAWGKLTRYTLDALHSLLYLEGSWLPTRGRELQTPPLQIGENWSSFPVRGRWKGSQRTCGQSRSLGIAGGWTGQPSSQYPSGCHASPRQPCPSWCASTGAHTALTSSYAYEERSWLRGSGWESAAGDPAAPSAASWWHLLQV